MVVPVSTNRIVVWIGRYLPAELGGLTFALLGAWSITALRGSTPVAAVAATWADMLIYYAIIITRDLRAAPRRPVLATLWNIVLEFGPAELLDSLLIRPTALYIGMAMLPSLPLGIIAGQIAANLCFYVPTIFSYEQLRIHPRGGVTELSGQSAPDVAHS
jgi:hypothetical protein